MATIKEVSQLARVSVATVSRVLNDRVPVTEAKRASVLAAVAQLGYQPNVFARSLATNRSGGIGVIVNELSSPYYSGVIQGIESVVEAQGMHLLVSSGHAGRLLETRAVEFLRQRRPDALIVQLEATTDADLAAWSEHELPIVVLGRYIDALAPRCIHLDNHLGGYLATRHLIDCGHRRIAHIAGKPALKDARDRLDGYRRALLEAGIAYDDALVVDGGFLEQGGQEGMQRLLERDLGLTAVFAANDQSAAGALHTMRTRGVRVPDDISLIGYDDVLLARYLYPALTTVRQPFVEMGQAAAMLALSALGAGDPKEVRRQFDPVLIERASVAALQS
jgi:LacI family transcriptional regulator